MARQENLDQTRISDIRGVGLLILDIVVAVVAVVGTVSAMNGKTLHVGDYMKDR